MSYNNQAAGASYGAGTAGRGGSVKAARERLAAMEASQYNAEDDVPRARYGLPSRPNESLRPIRPARGDEILTPPPSNDRDAAFSPGPGWPLKNESEEQQTYAQSDNQRQRGPPPQRPPRPDYVPSLLLPPNQRNVDVSRQQQQQQHPHPHQQRHNQQLEPPSPDRAWPEDDYLSPTSFSPNQSRPITVSSQGSVASSLGDIPDFPLPVMPPNAYAKRASNFGPPPSARRGPSSYYSHMSYVSPIAEESEAHKSYASSAVIPQGAQDFYFDDGEASDAEPMPMSGGDDRRSPPAAAYDDQSNLVRKASLGRRQKAALTTIKTPVDNMRMDTFLPSSETRNNHSGTGAAVPLTTLHSRPADVVPPARSNSRGAHSNLSSGTGFRDSSSSSSETLPDIEKSETFLSDERSIDPRVDSHADDDRLGDIKIANDIHHSPDYPLQMPARQTSLADRVGTRRPPRLNVDAVREAEARGSLTSLPDLIRRATRLRTNLDRGRTASRLGLDWFLDEGNANKMAAARPDSYTRRSGSLSDMLAAFPPPALGTPTGDKTPNQQHRMSRWPSGPGASNLSREVLSEKQERRGRRCCGLPMWGFILLLVILICLIAAAVVVPIVLIVLPKQQDNNTNTVAASELSKCQASLQCANGGTVILTSGNTCSCLCSNGFTGEKCTTERDAGCTTTNIAGTANNATLGSSIPRLLQGAQTNYSIPLDPSRLLAIFSSTDLSCTSENALVTFNGVSARSVFVEEDAKYEDKDEDKEPSATTPLDAPAFPVITSQPLPPVQRRDDAPTEATSKGILIDPSVATASPTTSSSAAKSTSSASSSGLVGGSREDFARVSVLFILQETGNLNTAVSAQEALQSFFSGKDTSNDAAKNVTLGGKMSVNLVQQRIMLANGTMFGGTS